VEIPLGSYIYIEDMAGILERGEEKVTALLLDGQGRDVRALMDVLEKEGPEALTVRKIPCTLDSLTKDERTILRAGCLINYYREGH
jgi:aconitate hydratase